MYKRQVLKFVQSLQKEIPINNMYIKILFKLLAIAYICQIASNICEDLGYRSISFQIETIGKVSILLLSIPIIQSLLETVESVSYTHLKKEFSCRSKRTTAETRRREATEKGNA